MIIPVVRNHHRDYFCSDAHGFAIQYATNGSKLKVSLHFVKKVFTNKKKYDTLIIGSLYRLTCPCEGGELGQGKHVFSKGGEAHEKTKEKNP